MAAVAMIQKVANAPLRSELINHGNLCFEVLEGDKTLLLSIINQCDLEKKLLKARRAKPPSDTVWGEVSGKLYAIQFQSVSRTIKDKNRNVFQITRIEEGFSSRQPVCIIQYGPNGEGKKERLLDTITTSKQKVDQKTEKVNQILDWIEYVNPRTASFPGENVKQLEGQGNYWSRRINKKNRILYQILPPDANSHKKERVRIHSVWGHY
jgi:Txe/YoeB family toxin of Txe-Axe toxin-antitoxin module